MLYRYTRLQQKLTVAKKWTRIRAARQLNPWIEAAYGEHGQELVARIRHDASIMSLLTRFNVCAAQLFTSLHCITLRPRAFRHVCLVSTHRRGRRAVPR